MTASAIWSRILSANWDRSSTATPFASEVVGLRAIHQRASVVRYAEFGELHCKLGHAVQIEPGLRSRSPKNGNTSNIRRRLPPSTWLPGKGTNTASRMGTRAPTRRAHQGIAQAQRRRRSCPSVSRTRARCHRGRSGQWLATFECEAKGRPQSISETAPHCSGSSPSWSDPALS